MPKLIGSPTPWSSGGPAEEALNFTMRRGVCGNL
jgi:hypothetical protein